MSGFAPPPKVAEPHTGCCLIQRANQGYALQPWHHSHGCRNYRPIQVEAISVRSAMTGETRTIEVVRGH